MLSENIKNLRKERGVSQEELAARLNVVRQTLSKWENGLSVPDSDMLIALAEELGTSVSTLLGETITESPADDLKSISKKLEDINFQLAKRRKSKMKAIRWALIFLCALTAVTLIALAAMNGSYMNWDYGDPELAIAGTMLHGFEFLFVRLAPIALLAFVIGIIVTYRESGR